MNIQTDITSSLRAMRAAARPCGTSEDGRTVLAIHLDERRADDLLAAADEIDRITEAGMAHIRRAAQFEDERDALRDALRAELAEALEWRDAAQEELRKCQQDAISLQAELAALRCPCCGRSDEDPQPAREGASA